MSKVRFSMVAVGALLLAPLVASGLTALSSSALAADVKVIPVAEPSHSVAVAPDGETVYLSRGMITDQVPRTVSALNTRTNQSTTIRLDHASARVGNVAVSPSGAAAYVPHVDSAQVGWLSVIDTARNTVADVIRLPSWAQEVAVSPDGETAYVTGDYPSGEVSVIDTDTNTVARTIPVGYLPQGLQVTPDGERVYVANAGSDEVSVIDTSSEKVTKVIDLPDDSRPWAVAISPDGNSVYVTCRNLDSNERLVSVIDSRSNAVSATIPVKPDPFGIAVAPNGRHAYVTDGRNSVQAINTKTNKVVDTIAVQGGPRGLAFTPNGATAYVSSTNTRTVSAISFPVQTVAFHANGGRGVMPDQVANVTMRLDANRFTRDGHTFSGWATRSNGRGTHYDDRAEYPFNPQAGSYATLYAQWEADPIGRGTTVVARPEKNRLVPHKRTRLIKAVRTKGTVAKVETTCRYRSQQLPSKNDRKRLCKFDVKLTQATSTRNGARVWVTPHCATDLKAKVRIVTRNIPGEGRDVWKRTWKVRQDTSDRCSVQGNG